MQAYDDQRREYLQAIRNLAEAQRAVQAAHDEYTAAVEGGIVNDQVAGWRQRVMALARLIEEEQICYAGCVESAGG